METHWLKEVVYSDALDLQEGLVAERNDNPHLVDQFLLLEHPPTYTLGIRGDRANLLLDAAAVAAQGFAVHHVRRGGDITYHGPGQLVGYPIINLKRLNSRLRRRSLDVRSYVSDLEQVIIQALSEFDIRGRRFDGYIGVWVDTVNGPAKVAAIGAHVAGRERITSHGFALNVMPNMAHFANIIPCGIKEYAVVSMAELVKRPLNTTDLIHPIIHAFSDVFKTEMDTNLVNV